MNSDQGRRRLLQSAAAWTVAAGLPSITEADEPMRDPIIDTHQHLWDISRFDLPWLKAAAALNRSFLMRDYLEATRRINVVRSVYMEVDVAPAQNVAEANYVLDLIQKGGTPLVAAVIGGRPESEGFAAYLARFDRAAAVKGVRRVLHGPETPAGHCLQAPFVEGVRLLGKKGLSFDLCMRPGELSDADKLIAACPDTAFILDHCGNAPVGPTDRSKWKSDLARIARRKNVVCKVSGIVTAAPAGRWTIDDLAPVVNHVLEAFGPDRVMFGGDWPVCTLAATLEQWVGALRTIVSSRPAAERTKLFHDNAVRVYRLA